MKNQKDMKTLICLGILAVVLIGLFIGIGLNAKNYTYALGRRIPKIYAMVLTGGAIGYSSLIFQTVTNNRILTPSILGLDSLYMLLQTTVIFVFGSTSIVMTQPNASFLLTMVVMLGFSMVLYRVLFKRSSQNLFLLLLIGVVVGTLFESLTSFMQVMIDPVEFLAVQDKMMASFNNINTSVLGLATLIFIGVGLYSMQFMKVLDVMALGKDHAINLGVDYDGMVRKILVVVVILTATSTALVGPITFLGLLVVNIARHVIGTYRHRVLTIAALLISVIALVGGQLLVEQVLGFGMSMSVIINFVGGIYFITLLMKERTS